MITGRTVTAEEADRRGLVSELVEPEALGELAVSSGRLAIVEPLPSPPG